MAMAKDEPSLIPPLLESSRLWAEIAFAVLLLTPSGELTPDQWGARFRRYPRWAAIPGPRDPHLTPYVIPIERAIADTASKVIVVMCGAQSGKTELLLDCAGQRLDQRPAPILYVGPNKQFLTEQFEPRVMALLDEAPTLADKIARGKRMTKTRKMIGGVSFRLAHAGSPAALKSDPAALALIDEYDQMAAVKGQGDPLGLVTARGDTYPDFCAVITSTCSLGMVQSMRDDASGLQFWGVAPAEDVQSQIWRLWQGGTRHHWCWPCPHCREYFVPRFECLRYPENVSVMEAARGAFLECPRCGGVIEEKHKADMNARGHYVAPGQIIDRNGVVTGEVPEASALTFWISGLCSPFVSFGDRVRTYLEAVAMGDDAMIQTAINAGFGELYSPGGRDVREWQEIARRRLPHRFGEVPDGVQRLTATVDVGKNYLCYSIRGWGARASSWQILSDELHGFTNEPEIWNDLANVLLDTYGGLPISLALIDSGFRVNKIDEGPTNVVYDFCRRFTRFVRPTKGYAVLDAPIKRGKAKVTIPGRKIQVQLELVRLDTDFWKSRLCERLAWPTDSPGGFWLSADATDDYCKQLVSEVRKLSPSGKPEWIVISRRNHYFDCEAMQEAAGHMLGVQKIPVTDFDEPPSPPDNSSPRPPTVTAPPPAPAAPSAVPRSALEIMRARARQFGARPNR
jgi:phage terminase large subunit GpA-like protein